MSEKIQAVRGMNDILPDQAHWWERFEDTVRDWLHAYGYRNIRMPVLERTDLFVRSIGEVTDIVEKEMYSFEDSLNGDRLTLRPEGTAGAVRAINEHSFLYEGGKRLYYIGPMFRHERPQKGRYRQFFQIGAEAIGSESPLVDAEVIEMVSAILTRTGLEGANLIINSVGCKECRPAFLAELRSRLQTLAPSMCGDCQRRADTNPLRVLDCKVPEDQPHIETLPSILDHLCETCSKHFVEVRSILDARGIAYEVRPRLVRGLDYYMRTTFEITHGALGAQNSVLGGGRYDGLAESIGSRVPAPGIGFSIGEDRLVMSVEELSDLIIHNLDVIDFLDIIGVSIEDLVAQFQDEIRENFASLARAVE